MTVHSYLEYALTLLGWLINNDIWNTMTATGLFALPLLFILLSFWLKAREQRSSKSDAGTLTLTWMENTVYVALLVIMFTCIPLLEIDITTIKYDVQRSKQCNVSIPTLPEQSGYAPLVNDISGKTASVPVWWYLIHVVSKGITNAATATLPCKTDLRQLRFDIQHIRISDQLLSQELLDFAQECYAPSWVKLMQHEITLTESEINEVAWIGSRWFLTQSGYYDTYHARSPNPAWPYEDERDAGLFNSGNGGYPTCKQWWSDTDRGLRLRLISLVKPEIWQELHQLPYGRSDYEEAILRTMTSPQGMAASQSGNTYSGYGGNVDPTLTNRITRKVSSANNTMKSFVLFPTYDSLRQALPMVQAILLMALVISIPLVTLFSAYNPKTVIIVTFAQFGLIFLSFWWELTRWLDTSLLELMYGSDTNNPFGVQNTADGLLMQFVLGTMFIALPVFWMGTVSWAGFRTANALEGIMKVMQREVRCRSKKFSSTHDDEEE
ncbi:conjugal transfer protein TraG N-terminal domain-containing protein [Salmonella enterica subsp. enterica]|uniref:conjugal transfer protein TraG N-terminal domain-containing protein n=1 Tax=Salmonella enterica TaxID=28901 RepID=UPI00107861C1|nr:conjugal transfer protein TraG [Salmonella enterica]EAO1508416.1 conjugal transfer protein TraG [Salmonella enterica subsp. enterica serovar Bere]EBX2983854.1 conjugal transfer protein TraG [Salmonella enterica subsp. enterica serovar Glostrup]ECF6836573.1 conjugal transfer protein TraG [Salmonella enterica subsp. enterica]EEJ2508060.1 conjugal transfer protein TraG [Salmonella enterica subsp. arizonae serovar 47:z4,z23:-]EHJ5081370.1 conjugal transfer protein TraG N-terminal domain-contain